MKSYKTFIFGIVFVSLFGFALPAQTIHADAVNQTGSTTSSTDTTGSTTQANIAPTDTTPPVITAPADQTFATSTLPAFPVLTPATDDADPKPTITYSPTSFPVGTTTVTWTATDASGNSSTATSNVIIVDDSSSIATSTATSTNTTATSTTNAIQSNSVSSVSTTTGTVTVALRDGPTLIGPFTVTLPDANAASVAITPTGSTTAYAVSARSVLALLSSLDAQHSEFNITDLQYYNGYQEFLLNCIDVPSASSQPDCYNWTYAVDGHFPSSGMDQYVASPGDTIYVFFGNPWQLSLSTSTVSAGETATTTASLYDPATGAYVPAAGYEIGATQPNPDPNNWEPIEIATTTADSNGEAAFTLTNAGSYNIGVTETQYYPTVTLTISSSTATTNSSGGNSGGSNSSTSSATPSASSAFSFLTSQQNADGSFSADVYTDWAAIALALPDAPSSARSKMFTYLKNAHPSLSATTDYERHAMALMALGINPYSGAGTDYIGPIVSQLTVGSAPINGQVFGLIALANAGYTSSDSVIQKTVSSVLGQQAGNGSWFGGDTDLTSAAIQALSQFNSISSVPGAIVNAEAYLHTRQQNDGGFGDSDSTSWVLNAIAARGGSPSSWTMNGSTPLSYLATQQQPDGGMTTASDSGLRAWSTAYALTAMESRGWASLMTNFSKPTTTSTGGGMTTATTTTDTLVSTTTLAIATSTPVLVPTDTSLPIISTTTTHLIHAPHVSIIAAKTNVSATSTASSSIAAHALTASVADAVSTHPFMHFVASIFGWIGSFFSNLF